MSSSILSFQNSLAIQLATRNSLSLLKSIKINILTHMRNKKNSSKSKRTLLLKIKHDTQLLAEPNHDKNILIVLTGSIDQKRPSNQHSNLKNHAVVVVMYLKELILKLDILNPFSQKCLSQLNVEKK